MILGGLPGSTEWLRNVLAGFCTIGVEPHGSEIAEPLSGSDH
jgi:hypothetical protein